MPKKILIVEDDHDITEMLRLALTGPDYVIHTAVTGVEPNTGSMSRAT